MKLINANEVKDSLLTELLVGVDGGTDDSYLKTYEVIDRIEKIVNEWVDGQITVEAIHIEWLREYENKIFRKPERKRFDWQVIEVIDKLLEDWEKENERTKI